MPNLEDVIDDFVAGTNKTVVRDATGINPADPVQTIYMTCKKASPGLLDDSDAIWKKTITISLSASHGQITANGDGSGGSTAGKVEWYFELQQSETGVELLRKGLPLEFDMKAVTVSGKEFVPFKGKLVPAKPVTNSP
jgi:hypothetical protein